MFLSPFGLLQPGYRKYKILLLSLIKKMAQTRKRDRQTARVSEEKIGEKDWIRAERMYQREDESERERERETGLEQRERVSEIGLIKTESEREREKIREKVIVRNRERERQSERERERERLERKCRERDNHREIK